MRIRIEDFLSVNANGSRAARPIERRPSLAGLCGALVLWAVLSPLRAATDTNSWPMLAHDPERSGGTPAAIRPPFERKWYRLFASEGLMSGIQPIVAEGKVFLGTLRGTFYALDAETGKDLWHSTCGGAILHTAAWEDGRVFFGCADGSVYCLDGTTGKLVWEVQTGAALWNAPVIAQGLLVIGGRDQEVYAIETQTGHVRWTGSTAGAVLGSPAIDQKRGRAYVASEDMHVYSFDLSNGRQNWRSPKLPGVSFRGYHPVIAPDGSVLVTAAPGLSVDTFQALLLEMVKAIFGDFASWRHSNEANAILREENFALMQKPETYPAQMKFLRQRLTEDPSYQTFFVLHPDTGQIKCVPPIVYSESMNGPGAPAVVSPDGKVIVKYQALLRSRYEHYSPLLNVGELDTTSGDIRPLMDQSRTYGWYDSLLLVHDEQSQLTVSGQVLINTHQDNVNGLDTQTLEGFTEPFCRNIHEPKPGEALAIWTRLLRDEPLPPGKEWLARGTAVYGGGSVLDTAVTVAGDSFYYLPTHELSAGAAVIAYRMEAGGTAGQERPQLPLEIRPEERGRIAELPWDWDTMESRRLTHVLDALPEKIPGTRQQPLQEAAVKRVAAISDADLDRVIWEARARPGGESPSVYSAGLREDIAKATTELIGREWQPLTFPSGKFPEESYRFFTEPTETLLTLAWAYPHLEAALQGSVREYVRRLSVTGGVLEGRVGRRTRAPDVGEGRSWYEPAPEKRVKFQESILRQDVARLYPFWAWAQASGDWSKLEREWTNLVGLVNQRPNPMEEDCRNAHLAGLIAYCRIADHLRDGKARDAGVSATRKALRERLEFELAHTQGGLIWQVPKMRSAFSRWHFLTPEVGRLLGQFSKSIHADLMARYVDYHRPTWWLAWNVETLMRNESPYELPTSSADVFAARSLILQEPPAKLALFIDRPWCRADEYYIQKLVLTVDAARPPHWVDTRRPAE